MERRTLHGGRLRAAAYDARAQRLEIDFVDGERRAFKAVPPEVWRRLVAAPNPAVFYADRIEEEYAFERARANQAGDARSKLDSLFGSNAGTTNDEPPPALDADEGAPGAGSDGNGDGGGEGD
ncbi:MAG: KTSC domain-containing protein [Burkholderiaceae bacterium]|nr:KTSC domain-containing protein [Burkholderiaceae bacterium]